MLKKKIFLLGAYDRFNYGDLLFPIIVENILKSFSPQLEFYPYALIESDLSVFGARKTLPINTLYQRVATTEDRVVIFAGGGVIGASWGSMRMNLSTGIETRMLKLFRRFLGPAKFDAYCQKHFASPSRWPWVADSSDFGVETKVLYNAVGGSFMGRINSEEREAIIDKLNGSAYLSVRDAETKRILARIDKDDRVKLVPDSAVVMSRLFSKTKLRKLISPSVREKIEEGRPYFCFQIGLGYAEGEFAVLAAALELIAKINDWEIVLLPIGRAQGHEDHTWMRKLKPHITGNAFMPRDDIGIYDIMALIAESELFIGTSLHGAVTSQSYAIPHIGLSGVTKLEFYLETWEIPSQVECANVANLPKRVADVVATQRKELEDNRNKLIDIAMGNFKNLARAADLL